ncbi:MAG: hypothetical protein IJ359_02285 [Erysipelotrichaceae bacterium]|nr:hypothetical protein [Erysipelotrichaceae bacterium]
MLKNKIKSLLSLKGFSFADYARTLKITPQSLQTKAKNEAYKIKDLVQLGELTNTTLAFIDRVTGKVLVEFGADDLNEEKE